jgi:hypothetical protein
MWIPSVVINRSRNALPGKRTSLAKTGTRDCRVCIMFVGKKKCGHVYTESKVSGAAHKKRIYTASRDTQEQKEKDYLYTGTKFIM